MAKNQRDFFKKKNEWSEIKDTLLRCYLPQYFQKLLVSGKPIFYIDCFAGKGKFDDGNDGSPLNSNANHKRAVRHEQNIPKEQCNSALLY